MGVFSVLSPPSKRSVDAAISDYAADRGTTGEILRRHGVSPTRLYAEIQRREIPRRADRLYDRPRIRAAVLGLAGLALAATPTRAQSQYPTGMALYEVTQVGTATLALTTTSANVSLGTAAPTVWVTNVGQVPACVALGVGSGTTASAASCPNPIQPGFTIVLGEGSNTYLAGITPSGTSSLDITTGYLSVVTH